MILQRQIITVPVAKDANLDLGFSPADVTLTREGDNLVFTFEDGGKVVVSDFYAAVTKDTLPDFLIDGQKIAGADFFAALGEDLQPAAGTSTQPRGANFNEYDGANLLGGVDSLGGKESGYERTGQADGQNNGQPGIPTFTDTVEGVAGTVTVASAGGGPVIPPVGGGDDPGGDPVPPPVVDYNHTDADGDAPLFNNTDSTSLSMPLTERASALESSDKANWVVRNLTLQDLNPNATTFENIQQYLPTSDSGTFSLAVDDKYSAEWPGDPLRYILYFEPTNVKIAGGATPLDLAPGETAEWTGNVEFLSIQGEVISMAMTFLFTGTNANADILDVTGLSTAGFVVTNVKTTVTGINASDKSTTLDLGHGDDKLNFGDVAMAKGYTVKMGDGDDTVTMSTMTGGRVEGGAGDDKITVAEMSGTAQNAGYVTAAASGLETNTFSLFNWDNPDLVKFDTGVDNKIVGGAGNDTITVGKMTNANIFGEEAFRDNGKEGGKNVITVGSEATKGTTVMSGTSNIFGDGDLSGAGTVGSSNTINVYGNMNVTTTNMDVASTTSGYKIGQEGIVAGQRNVAHGATAGNDSITLHGSLITGEILGEHNVFDGAKAGSDTIHVTGNMQGGYIAGEAMVSGNSFAGADTITVDGNFTGGSIVGTYGLLDKSTGADNTITIGGNVNVTLQDDAKVGYWAGAVEGVSIVNDSKAGNDTIIVKGDVQKGGVFGEGYLQNNATGGDNTIEVQGTLSGGIVAGSYQVQTSSTAGNDSITINNMTGGTVYGDGIFSGTDNTAGNDTIKITTMSGGTVYGDGTGTGYTAGQNTIDIGTMKAGTVNTGAGNDELNITKISTSSTSQTTITTGDGNDVVNIGTFLVYDNSKTETDWVYGKDNQATLSTGAGDDSINIGTLHSGTINADAGKDTITIDKMGYGKVNAGADDDSLSVGLYTGGNIDGGTGHDTITIGTLVGGTQSSNIVFDGVDYNASGAYTGTISGGAGDDIITVNNFSQTNTSIGLDGNAQNIALTGKFAQVIDGGTGTDVFIYNNNANHNIVLNANGTVKIDSVQYDNIKNFEGIGGGAGNDVLDARGYTGGAILIGGGGNDILYGGSGVDTFKWNISDLGDGTDNVMNFEASKDKIVIEGTADELKGLSVAYVDGSATSIAITHGEGAGAVTQTIEFGNTAAASAAVDQIAQQIQAATG